MAETSVFIYGYMGPGNGFVFTRYTLLLNIWADAYHCILYASSTVINFAAFSAMGEGFGFYLALYMY